MHQNISTLLAEGDRRTIGKADEAVVLVLNNPERFTELFSCLADSGPGVIMRASDAIEKISELNPEIMTPYIDKLISIARSATQQELQWHIAQIAGHVRLSKSQSSNLYEILLQYYKQSKSSIVKVFSLTSLYKLAKGHPQKMSKIKSILSQAEKHGTPSVSKRAAHLLAS